MMIKGVETNAEIEKEQKEQLLKKTDTAFKVQKKATAICSLDWVWFIIYFWLVSPFGDKVPSNSVCVTE